MDATIAPQAARSGHKEIIEILTDHGADINERTDWGNGQSVLDIAYDNHDEDSDFIKWLIEMGAEWDDYAYDEEF